MNFKKHCMGYVAAALFAFADVSLAAPGAHGPNGEHLDGPATQVQGSSAPRLETRSESFEMVGRLSVSEFSMFINRYETNHFERLGACLQARSAAAQIGRAHV